MNSNHRLATSTMTIVMSPVVRTGVKRTILDHFNHFHYLNPYIEVRSRKPASQKFFKLISSRLYRLMIRTDSRSSRDTAGFSVNIKSLTCTMKSHELNGNFTIKNFASMTRYAHEADMLNISEVQEFIALLIF